MRMRPNEPQGASAELLIELLLTNGMNGGR